MKVVSYRIEQKEKSKKKKNQGPKGPDPAITNCIQEINHSLSSNDKEKLRKAIKHASEFDLGLVCM